MFVCGVILAFGFPQFAVGVVFEAGGDFAGFVGELGVAAEVVGW